MLNASNSQSDPSLKKENKERRKWGAGVNEEGFMTIGKVDHSDIAGVRLANHKERRDKAVNLINRDMNEYADSGQAMSEIVGRKNLRAAQYRELKSTEYKFAEDDKNAEFLAMGTYKEGCSAGCKCAACRDNARKDAEYREWSGKKREEMAKGEVKGKFAGPDQSFPISNATDVKAAWSSVGRAKNPRAVMKRIIAIAKEMGLESALPESVRKRLEEGGSGLPG
jgi:hypothetical protein